MTENEEKKGPVENLTDYVKLLDDRLHSIQDDISKLTSEASDIFSMIKKLQGDEGESK